MVDQAPFAPDPGPGASAGALTPQQARKLFEFFPAGTHREVLLLGDLVEQPVHFVRSKGHKVLCAARVGVCDLCEKSSTSDDVSDQQTEFYVASFVRHWKEREFHQRVAVFSASAGEKVLTLFANESTHRGRRLDVERRQQGTSGRFVIKPLDSLPQGIPGVLPPAFDLVPFVRARFGRRQDPARPLVFLPSFSIERPLAGPAGRPRPLDLSAADCGIDPQTIGKLRDKLAEWRGEKPAEDLVEAEASVEASVELPRGELGVTAIAADPLNYGPRKIVAGGGGNGDVRKSAGEELLGEVLLQLPHNHPARRNGRPAKGGAQ